MLLGSLFLFTGNADDIRNVTQVTYQCGQMASPRNPDQEVQFGEKPGFFSVHVDVFNIDAGL